MRKSWQILPVCRIRISEVVSVVVVVVDNVDDDDD